MALEGTITWDTRPIPASLFGHEGKGKGEGAPVTHHNVQMPHMICQTSSNVSLKGAGCNLEQPLHILPWVQAKPTDPALLIWALA